MSASYHRLVDAESIDAEYTAKCDRRGALFPARLRPHPTVNGVFGLIATNTIAQGDTRASGLRWICKHNGEILSVRRRVKMAGASGCRRQRAARRKGGGCGPQADRRSRSSSASPHFCSTAAVTMTQLRLARPTPARAFSRQHTFSAWASHSTIPTRRVSHRRWPRCGASSRRNPRNKAGDLSLHRGTGGEHQHDAFASPLRHQLPGLSAASRQTVNADASQPFLQETLWHERRQKNSHEPVDRRGWSATDEATPRVAANRGESHSIIRSRWRKTGRSCWRSWKERVKPAEREARRQTETAGRRKEMSGGSFFDTPPALFRSIADHRRAGCPVNSQVSAKIQFGVLARVTWSTPTLLHLCSVSEAEAPDLGRSSPAATRSGRASSHPPLKTDSGTLPPIASRPSRSPTAGTPIRPWQTPASRTTSSAPTS